MMHPTPPPANNRLQKRYGRGKSIPKRILSRVWITVFALMLLASWAGYQVASRNLSQSLSALPKFKAISQADNMSASLTDTRDKFIQIRENIHSFTPDELRENMNFAFREHDGLIQEIGVKLPDNKGFILFRDKDTFVELSHDIASTGSYAPFQQLLTFNLSLNKVSLFPAVFYTPQGFANGSTPSGEAVMRMALPIDDETVLILGINFRAWSEQLIPQSLHKEFEEQTNIVESKTLQLAYFFDNAGWILSERSNQPDGEWHPNIARRGFGGDFGRQGYDAAFRPWAQHERYWRMVTDAREGRIGVIQESASDYSQDFKHNYGFLCYAPIFFAPNDNITPSPIGGIAFFESAPNIFASSLKTLGPYAALLMAGLLFFIMALLRFTRKIARPFTASAHELQTMLEQRDLHYLHRDTASAEHGTLVSSINTLITFTKGQSEQLDLMTATMQQTHAPLPIDIDRSISSAILAGEFGLVGSSKEIAHVRENIHKAAQAGTDVLIWGETGTGKELVASAIHKASSRKNGPYISINCGALDENLLMDTLFGHVAGAFSDAMEDRKGAFLAANGGTLHLDELGNASPKVQQSLLRALSVRQIRPLGSDKEIPFDTRVIAATNADLLKSANEGTFRQDLYYRLAIIQIHIPPLRERKEDIPELAAFYIIESCKRLKKHTTYLSRGALKALTSHSWPGNVREFSNCLTRAVAYTEGDLILPEHIAFEASTYEDGGLPTPSPMHGGLSAPSQSSHPADYLWPAPSRDNFSLTKEALQREQEKQEGFPRDTHTSTTSEKAPRTENHNNHGVGHHTMQGVPPSTTQNGSQAQHSTSRAKQTLSMGKEAYNHYGILHEGGNRTTPSHSSSPNGQQLASPHPSQWGDFPHANGTVPETSPSWNHGKGSSYDEHTTRHEGSEHSPLDYPRINPHKTAQLPHQGYNSPPMGHASFTQQNNLVPPQDGFQDNGGSPSPSLTPKTHNLYKRLLENGEINDRQLEALLLSHSRESFTRADYETVSGTHVSSRTIQNDLKELVSLGLLEKSGNGPATCYHKTDIPELQKK